MVEGCVNMKKLKDKNLIITGAASGIGRSLAIGLAKEGMNLFISDINMERLEKVKEEIEALGIKVFTARCDVTKYEDVAKLAEVAQEKLGDIDMLINNAGIGSGAYAETMELEDWKRVLDVNLWSIIYSIKVFLPIMLERGQGHFINTGSGAGIVGQPVHLDYCTSKFAVVGLSEALFSEIRDRGIHVSVICPTIIKSNIMERSEVRIPPELMKSVSEAELPEKEERFKEEFWKEYSKKGLTPEKAAKKYIKGIKRQKLFIFDKRILRVAMFIKAAFPSIYKKVLIGQGKEHEEIIHTALNNI